MREISRIANLIDTQNSRKRKQIQYYEHHKQYLEEKKEMLEDIKSGNLSKVKYLNNEVKLYKYIKANLNEDGLCVMNDSEVAKKLEVSITTVFRWRSALVKFGVIECETRFVNNKKQNIIKILT